MPVVVAQMSVKKMFVLQDWFHAVDNVVTQVGISARRGKSVLWLKMELRFEEDDMPNLIKNSCKCAFWVEDGVVIGRAGCPI
jgi:hypothetical protein